MSIASDRMSSAHEALRVAMVSGGIAGLTCARELILRGHDPVVFEASDRLGGRCSSLSTRAGLFDDGVRCISGARLRLGVCGDSAAASQVDRVHRSGVDMARAVAEGLGLRGGRSPCIALDRDPRPQLEAQL